MPTWPSGKLKQIDNQLDFYIENCYNFLFPDFYFAKLNIQNIFVLAFYGGVGNVPLEEYYNVNMTQVYNRKL